MRKIGLDIGVLLSMTAASRKTGSSGSFKKNPLKCSAFLMLLLFAVPTYALINETHPIIAYVTMDGNSGTENAGFIDFLRSNNITNFTVMNNIGPAHANFSVSTYDPIVDVYVLGGKFAGPTRTQIRRLNDSTKPIILTGSAMRGQWQTLLGICNFSDSSSGTSVFFQNNTMPVFNSSNGVATGNVQFSTSFTDHGGCSNQSNIKNTSWGSRSDPDTEYSDTTIEVGTRLESVNISNFTTKARWVAMSMQDGTSTATYLGNVTLINAINWAIDINRTTESEQAPVISSLTNATTTNQSVTITWSTNENANESNTMGVCPSYTGVSSVNTSYTTSHSESISGLSPNTNYCFNTTACDTSGNCAFANVSFFTAQNQQQQQNANESEGDAAILAGIQSSEIWTATVHDAYQVGAANTSNQFRGTFDKFAIKGSKRWALNYVSSGESSISGLFNITPTLYVLQLQNKTSTQITDEVGRLINSTYP